jgi:hypothetical protein
MFIIVRGLQLECHRLCRHCQLSRQAVRLKIVSTRLHKSSLFTVMVMASRSRGQFRSCVPQLYLYFVRRWNE